MYVEMEMWKREESRREARMKFFDSIP